MKITAFGHACVLVDVEGTRVLIDPGSFSSGLESLTSLDAILITHAHGDHLSVPNIQDLVKRNPQAVIYGDATSAAQLNDAGIAARTVTPGQVLETGLPIEVVGSEHAVIHPELPQLINHGYLIDRRFYHPGDAFTVPETPVEVLALPIGAPWMKSSEFIEFLRAVRPRVAIPIHEAVLAMPQMSHNLVAQLGPADLDYRPLQRGESTTA